MGNAAIADTLFLTVGTIKTHAAVLALCVGIIE
jgi:DNA-binding NarL/FixJ family response regulator